MLQHLRAAIRQISRCPAFAVLVIGTLGLTIGSATAVFSLLDAVLLRPFPYFEPWRLIRVDTWKPGVPASGRGVSVLRDADSRGDQSLCCEL